MPTPTIIVGDVPSMWQIAASGSSQMSVAGARASLVSQIGNKLGKTPHPKSGAFPLAAAGIAREYRSITLALLER